MGWFDLTDGGSYPLGNKRTFDRSDLKAMERCLGKIYKPAGKALEKVNNKLDSLQNLAEATNPAVRIYDALKSYSIEEAYEKLRKGDHIYVNRSVYSHHGI